MNEINETVAVAETAEAVAEVAKKGFNLKKAAVYGGIGALAIGTCVVAVKGGKKAVSFVKTKAAELRAKKVSEE